MLIKYLIKINYIFKLIIFFFYEDIDHGILDEDFTESEQPEKRFYFEQLQKVHDAVVAFGGRD